MPKLPDPDKYNDPIKFFRDCHALIITQVNLLEQLVLDAESKGVIWSLKKDSRWADLLDFFVNTAPLHEMDEEVALFPVVVEKIPHFGFQSPDSAKRFIEDQHEMLQYKSGALLRFWKESLGKNELSSDESTTFVRNAKELISLYREHVRKENEIIYTLANDELLSPQERQDVIEKIRENRSEVVQTAYLDFEEPTYTLKGYKPIIVSGGGEDAVSESTLESENEEEESEGEEGDDAEVENRY
ncbi:MAG: hemerythrin domain-containing protein [Candidatus Kapaibacterium sp.]